MARVDSSCCWAGSICPLGKLKPPNGCWGWKKGGRKRGATAVLSRIVTTVRRAAERHNLLFKRGYLQNEAEMRALAEALLEKFLPTTAPSAFSSRRTARAVTHLSLRYRQSHQRRRSVPAWRRTRKPTMAR